MQRIDVLIPKGMKVDLRVRLVDGLKSPKVITTQDPVDRIPFVSSFLMKHIEPLSHTLGGDYDELPPEINKVRWGIINGGYTDREVHNEVKQTLRAARGDFEAKKRLEHHISELLLPVAA